jgi:hypothetical protein
MIYYSSVDFGRFRPKGKSRETFDTIVCTNPCVLSFDLGGGGGAAGRQTRERHRGHASKAHGLLTFALTEVSGFIEAPLVLLLGKELSASTE